jgi:hypothetical protein
MTTNITDHIITLILNLLLTLACGWWVAVEPTPWSISILVLSSINVILKFILLGIDIKKNS